MGKADCVSVCVSPVYDVAPLSGPCRVLPVSVHEIVRSECVRVSVFCVDIQTHMLTHTCMMQGVGFYQSSLGGSRVTTPGFMSPLARD
jgi:hypothetical protein